MPGRYSTGPAQAVVCSAAVEAQNTSLRLIAPWVIAGLVGGGLVGILIGLLIAGAR